MPLRKAEQCSTWTARPLTQAQLEYAAADVEVLLEIYDRLKQGGGQLDLLWR